jgi:hypothetical protein
MLQDNPAALGSMLRQLQPTTSAATSTTRAARPVIAAITATTDDDSSPTPDINLLDLSADPSLAPVSEGTVSDFQ